MKRSVSLLAALALILALGGCSNSESNATPTPATQTPAAESAAPTAAADPYADLPEIKLTFATGSSAETAYCKGIQMLADKLSEATGGKFTIECYFNGSLGIATGSETDALSRGTLDMSIGSTSLYTADCPYLTPFAAAYVFESYDHYRAVMDSDLWAEMRDRIIEDLGIRMLRGDYTGSRHLNLKGTAEITKPEDMAAYRLRVSNNEATLFIAEHVLGAIPIGMNFSDVYQALQTGAIDGHENPLSTIVANMFYEVTDSVVLTGHQIEAHALAINENKYESLPQEYQDLLNNCWSECVDFIDETTLQEESELVSFLEDEGLVVYEIDKTPFIEQATKAYADYAPMQEYIDIYNEIKSYVP